MAGIGQNLKRLREDRNISQAELAKSIGVRQGTIGNLETGRQVSTKHVLKLAMALGVEPQEIDETYERGSSQAIIGATGKTPIVPRWISSRDRIAVYSSKDGKSWPYIKSQKPVSTVESIESVRLSSEAYALLIAWSIMEPELSPGDVAYINPDLPPLNETTCIFFKDESLTLLVIGRLINFTHDAWQIKHWNRRHGEQDHTLPREEWPICHRVVAKLFRA